MTYSTDKRGRFARVGPDTVYDVETVGTSESTRTVGDETCTVILANEGSGKVFFRTDSTTVTTANGIPIASGERFILDIDGGTTIRLIADASSTDLRVAEIHI